MIEIVGWIAMGLAALVAFANFYLSFIRGALHKLVGLGEYHHVSGAPMIGTICLLVAIVCLWGQPSLWRDVALIVLADTGGLPWFLLVMLWMYCFDKHRETGTVSDNIER